MKIFFLVFGIYSTIVEKQKIFIISLLGTKSHYKHLLEIGVELQLRGHELTYMAYEEDCEWTKSRYNFTTISLGKTKFDQSKIIDRMIEMSKIWKSDYEVIKSMTFISDTSYVDDFNRIKYILLEARPNLTICDFFAIACIDAVKSLDLPLILGYQSIDFPGIPKDKSITSTFQYTSLTIENMSIYDRFHHGIINPILLHYAWKVPLNKINKLRSIVGAKSTTGDIFNYWDNTMAIANSFFGFEIPRSLPPNLKLVGPILSPKNFYLDQKLNTFLYSRKNVLYIAFGSIVVLYDELLTEILKTIHIGLQDNIFDGVIWWLSLTDKNSFPKSVNLANKTILTESLFRNENLLITKWAPQVAVLNHNNTKLFWSHGGLDSSFEAFESGTKMLVMPFFGDQHRNAKKIETMGMGKYIDKQSLSAQNLLKLISDLIKGGNDINVLKIKKIMKYSERRRSEAADFIEEFSAKASVCKSAGKYDHDCYMSEYLTAETRMSYIKANLIDIYCLATFMLLLSFASVVYLKFKLDGVVFHRKIKKKID